MYTIRATRRKNVKKKEEAETEYIDWDAPVTIVDTDIVNEDEESDIPCIRVYSVNTKYYNMGGDD